MADPGTLILAPNTLARLTAAAAEQRLFAGEPYWMHDLQAMAVGTGRGSFRAISGDRIIALSDRVDPTGVQDCTNAFEDAIGDGNCLLTVPPGTYLLDNLRFTKAGTFIRGAGRKSTFFKQKTAGNYCVNVLSDNDLSEHLLECGLTDVTFLGHASASEYALNIEGLNNFAVRDFDLDVGFYQTYGPIRMSGVVYDSRFRIASQESDVRAYLEGGGYSTYDIFITGVDEPVAVEFEVSDSFVTQIVTESGIVITGQRNLVCNAKVEHWTGGGTAGSNIAIAINGGGNTLINPSIINVDADDCQYGITTNASEPFTIIGARIVGPSGAFPDYPLSLQTGANGAVVGFVSDSPFKVEQYTSAAIMAGVDFIGAVDTLTDVSMPSGRTSGNITVGGLVFANGHTETALNVLGDSWFGDYNSSKIINLEGRIQFRKLDQIVAGLKHYDVDASNGGITLQKVSGGTLADGLIMNQSGHFYPAVNNAQECGVASFSWSGGSTQVAFTVTCDARLKKFANDDFTEAHLRAAERIIDELGWFQWLDAIEEKGKDGARWHFGPPAQTALKIFMEEGLEEKQNLNFPANRFIPEDERPSFRTAFFTFDTWEARREEIFEIRKKKVKVKTGELEETGLYEEIGVLHKRKGPIRRPQMKTIEVEENVATGKFREVSPAGNRFGMRRDGFAEFLIKAQAIMRRRTDEKLAALAKRVEALEGG